MDSTTLPPIPTPPEQHWREFRIRLLPAFVFALVLASLFLTWSNFVQPVSIVGQVETNSVAIITTVPGLLTDLALNRFDEVTNGQILGQIEVFEPEQIKAEIAALISADNLAKAKSELMEWGKQDNAIATRQALFNEKMLLRVAMVDYQQASNVVAIDEKLRSTTNGVPSAISETIYLAHVAQRDALKSQVAGRIDLVDAYIKEMEQILPLQTNVFANLEIAVKADIAFQTNQLMQLQKPIILRAPMSGRIIAVNHHSGERVAAGTTILAIASSRADKILGFVRQPINFRPKVGDTVSVRTRTTRRKACDAQVSRVGLQLEPVNPMLLPVIKPAPELGLPIALTLPPELDLLPGELVDIKLMKK